MRAPGPAPPVPGQPRPAPQASARWSACVRKTHPTYDGECGRSLNFLSRNQGSGGPANRSTASRQNIGPFGASARAVCASAAATAAVQAVDAAGTGLVAQPGVLFGDLFVAGRTTIPAHHFCEAST